MKLLDLTLPEPAANLALDEALLDEAESGHGADEVLRLWESPVPFVVVGRSSRVDQEVRRDQCQREQVPILRRSSGGSAVVAGPGCLMYAMVLSYQLRPALRMIDQAHRFVLETVAAALSTLCPGVERRGVSDLTLNDVKFSGNSLRCRRSHLLYHGTVLYNFPLKLITTCLKTPPRQPEYRANRKHEQFVRNLPVDPADARLALIRQWRAAEQRQSWPEQLAAKLAREKYTQASWNLRL